MSQPVRNPDLIFCNKCGVSNPSRNKFCYDCGESLFAFTCSYCSTVNPHHATYCGMCGKKLQRT